MRPEDRKRLHRESALALRRGISPLWLIPAIGLGMVAGIALSLALGLTW